jgi:hypothetical protein
MDELAGVSAYVEHEVDGELGEEELVRYRRWFF